MSVMKYLFTLSPPEDGLTQAGTDSLSLTGLKQGNQTLMMLRTAVILSLVAVTGAFLYDSSGSFCCNPPKSLEEKIDRILDFNDNDGDGIMTPQDQDRDLILYDINDDCSVSRFEWAAVWSCRYGDTPDKAVEIFNMISQGEPSISFKTMRATAQNTTRADFETRVRAFYSDPATPRR
ncbi:uncharacterized protein LOC124147698 isoform X1 [Haliotis rufescens]|uniref:uncharacterized protein LOC124147698 isoform X1 n=1 Tax=Haliotis rufescens TaxID=6454 RepID=UPI00201EE6DE|nr:uncharacterized protein LOC124147698 isoform X1 [Haliotis rufescens]